MRFLLTGYGAELSLRPLGRALAARGLAATVVDLAHQDPAATIPAGEGPLVVVSSQHSMMSGPSFDAYHGVESHYAAPPVLRDRVGADLLVYVPHDLLDPVLPQDVAYLRQFDLYAAPDEDSWWASAHVRTVVSGWVGTAAGDDLPPGIEVDGVLFLAQVRWTAQQGGAAFLLRTFPNLMGAGLAMKLPLRSGQEDLVRDLEQAGVRLLDPKLNASSIVRHARLVVTNGPTSVLAEANFAGHRPVCVLAEEGDAEFTGQLGSLDVVVCRDADFPACLQEAGRVRPPAPDFDVDGFIAAVDAALREAGRV